MLTRQDLLEQCDRIVREAAALRVLLGAADLLPVQGARLACDLAKLGARLEVMRADVAGHKARGAEK